MSRLPVGPRNEVELPVYGHGRPIGRLVLVFPVDMTGVTIPPEDRALAVSLVDQLGVALATAAESPLTREEATMIADLWVVLTVLAFFGLCVCVRARL